MSVVPGLCIRLFKKMGMYFHIRLAIYITNTIIENILVFGEVISNSLSETLYVIWSSK